MDGDDGYIKAGTEQLHYLRWGKGSHILVAFHGYANDAGLFSPFIKYLEQDYTLLSFDLPHHGQSKWPENTPLTRHDLKSLIENIVIAFKTEKITLVGYSMGGRVCLTIIEMMPQLIDRVILIAPDGLKTDHYYYFLTQTRLGNKMFRNFLKNHEPWFKLLNWMKDKNLIDASRHKFITQYMNTEERRRFLLQVWPGMSRLMPVQRVVKDTIKKYKIPVTIFMGAFDKIIPPSLARNFIKGLDTAKLVVLEKGHRVFDQDNAQLISGYLLK